MAGDLAHVPRRVADFLKREARRDIEAAVARHAKKLGVKPREVYQPLRVALTGTTVSPGMFESVALLGREQTLARIDRATARIR